MKKLLAILLLALTCAFSAVGFTACSNTSSSGKDGANGQDGVNGQDGIDGQDGVGVKSAEIDENGDLILTMTDDKVINAGNIVDNENPQGLNFYLLPDGTYAVSGGAAIYLEEITIPSTYKGKAVTQIASGGLTDHDGAAPWGYTVKNIIIPDSVTKIERYAFMCCYSLTSITIGSGVTSIGDDAFRDCRSLLEVYNKSNLPITVGSDYGELGRYAKNVYTPTSGSSKLSTENGCVIFDGKLLVDYSGNEKEVTIPDGIEEISESAFANRNDITSIIIPDSVTNIGSSAFSGCSGLTSITIGNGVTNIEYKAFYGCSSLTTVTIPDSVTNLGYYAFSGCSALTSITIPDSVTNLGYYAFRDCGSLTTVTIGNGITNLDVFNDCNNLTAINVSDSNKNFTSINGNVYSKNGATLIKCFSGKTATEFTIPNSVTSIGSSAFSACTGLTKVTIPDSVISIGSYAFSNCTCEIKWGDNPSIKTIDDYAFSNYKGTSITIPDSVTRINNYAFEHCSNLTGIAIPDSVTSIEWGAFSGCSSLTSITIPDSVTSISGWVFDGCDSLTYNEYDNGYYLGNKTNPYLVLVKAKSTYITSCTIHDNTKVIANYAFDGCNSLTSITLPAFAINSIPKDKLQTVEITSGEIGSWTFQNFSSLTEVTIHDSVTSIGSYAFDGCSSLTSINYSGTMEQWNNMSKSISWDNSSAIEQIICTDGTIEL